MGTKCGPIQVPALPHTVGRWGSLVGIMEAAVSSNHTANEPFSPDDQTAGNSFRLVSRRSKATVLPPSRGGHLICQPNFFTPTSEVRSLSLSPGTVSCGSWEGQCHGQHHRSRFIVCFLKTKVPTVEINRKMGNILYFALNFYANKLNELNYTKF